MEDSKTAVNEPLIKEEMYVRVGEVIKIKGDEVIIEIICPHCGKKFEMSNKKPLGG